MNNIEDMFAKIMNADYDELKEMKLWLFKESIRIKQEKAELSETKADLEDARSAFEHDKAVMEAENRRYETHLSIKNKQLRTQEELLNKKLETVKRGFDNLDIDRRALNAREMELRMKEAEIEDRLNNSYSPECSELEDVLFRGADNMLLLKKRYKDLMKMYHPDCLGGDNQMVQAINRAYDRQLKEYDLYDKRRRA